MSKIIDYNIDNSYGVVILTILTNHGFTMVLPWFYHGFTMFSPKNNPKHCGPAQAKPSPLILRRVTTVMASSCTWKDLARQGGKETGVFCVKQKQQKECNYIILYTWFHEFGLRLLVL
jgi:hypothetical protein